MFRIIVLNLTFLGFWIILQGCAEYQAEKSCNFIQNSYGERISWNDNVPIPLYVHESFINNSADPQAFNSLKYAIKKWNENVGNVFYIAGIIHGKINFNRDSYNTIYLLNNWQLIKNSPGNTIKSNDELKKEEGRTIVHSYGNQINEVDIFINGEQNLSSNNNLKNNETHTPSLLIHELGHGLGLKHIESNPSIMASINRLGEKRHQISDLEIQSLACEYDILN